jgi:hypothetical protein
MPSTTKVPLKYLFAGWYKDGRAFAQNKEDVSVTDPKRSSFYDVKVDEVETFGIGAGDFHVSVDLETGRFFTESGQRVVGFYVGLPGPKPYKLIFWRQHTHNFNIGLDELSHEVKYKLGYEDADGKEHVIIIE